MYYVNIREGLKSAPRLVSFEENVTNYTTDKEKDYYQSLFLYNEDHKNLLKERGTLSGIKDTVTDRLYFDFDSKSDIEQARKDALEACFRLVDGGVKEDSVAVYFSGSKGINVEVKLDKLITPEEFKQYVTAIAGDLVTFDKVVHDPNRIIRIPNTKHNTSKLYKVALSLEELETMTVDDIKSIATKPRNTPSLSPSPLPKVAIVMPLKKEKVKKVEGSLRTKLDTILANKPRHWKDYKYALASGFFEPGERHQALMVVAATCRGLGYDQLQTYHFCKATIERQAEIFDTEPFDKKELWENIIEKSVFSDNWQGGQFSPKNNEWLRSYCERWELNTNDPDDVGVTQLDDIRDGFIDYVKNIDKNTILTGIQRLDEAVPLTIGMNLGIIGAASSGKTALALSILKNTSKAGVFSVFASLDMHRNRLYEKLLYKISGYDRNTLYKMIQEGRAEEIFNKIKEDYGNVYFYDRSCPTVDDIRNYINQIQDKTGNKVKLVMLDYFERVGAERSDDTAASKEVAGKLQDLINDFNICLITLVQPNKFALTGGPDTPILNYTSIKGSSFLYQSFRSIISIWRPFFTPETARDDKYMQMAVLKNDLGELGTFNFHWEGKRGEIRELMDEEADTLEILLAEKQEKKAKTDDQW